MTPFARVLLIAVLMALCPGVVGAQHDGPDSARQLERGARRLFGHVEPPPFDAAVEPDAEDAAGRYVWLARTMPNDLRDVTGWLARGTFEFFASTDNPFTMADATRAYESHQAWIDSLDAATQLSTADYCFGDGFRMLAYTDTDPRSDLLGSLRRMQKVLVCDGVRWARAGRMDKACDRFIAAIRFAEHVCDQDASLLVGLVADSMLQGVLSDLDTFLDSAKGVSPRSLAAVSKALESFDDSDPAGLRARYADLRAKHLTFTKAQLVGDEGMDALRFDLRISQVQELWINSFRDDVLEAFEGGGDVLEAISFTFREHVELAVQWFYKAAALHPVNLRRSLVACESLSSDIDARWDNPDFTFWYESRLLELGQDHSGMRFWMNLEIAPSVHRYWNDERVTLTRLRARLAELQGASPPHR
jgi:hypothetical protein